MRNAWAGIVDRLPNHLPEPFVVALFGFRTPIGLKMPGLRPKHLLRSIATKRLPEGLLRLPKHGFSAPVRTWIARTHQDMFRADVLDTNSDVMTLVDRARVTRMFHEHCAGTADHSLGLWAIWMLARWRGLACGAQSQAARPEVAAAPYVRRSRA